MIRERFELVHRREGDFHVITSPQLRELVATGLTREEAEREALALIGKIQDYRGRGHEVLAAVEYVAA